VLVTLDGEPSNDLTLQVVPKIESVVPEHPKAGEMAEIHGYGFDLPGQSPSATLLSVPAQIASFDNETIRFSFYHSCVYGPGSLTVTVGDASASKNIVPQPYVAPGTTDAGVPGQRIGIAGEGFGVGSQIYLSGTQMSDVTVMGNSSITFTVPSSAVSGELKVVIPASSGQTQTESNSIYFTVGPKPSSISRDYGSPGDLITVGGSFGTDASIRKVFLGLVECAISSSSQSEIKFWVPSIVGLPSGIISITVDSRSAPYLPFTVLPAIAGVSSNICLPGEEVRVYGYFGNAEIIASGGSVRVSALGKGTEGGRDYFAFVLMDDFEIATIAFSVKRYLGTGNLPFAQQVLYVKPSIVSVDPPIGSPGDLVTLSGFHFSPYGQTPIVAIGSSSAEVVTTSDQSLIVKVPEGEGQVRVSVFREIMSGFAESPPSHFRYLPVPRTWLPVVPIKGGMLRIDGAGFSPVGNNQVYVGGKSATIVSATPYQLNVRLDPASPSGDLKVVSDGVASLPKPIKVAPNLAPILSLLMP